MARLPAPYGIRIDRSQAISFSFEGKKISALKGDSIASALLANRQSMISRSFKYHRPRGLLTMAGQDANTLVQLPALPNTLADVKEVEQGLTVKAQNYTGWFNFDLQAFTGIFSRFLPVGFYYRAFFKPKGIWEYWAKFIRKQAGLGVIDQSFEPGYFDKQYKFADVVVVGGGPAGMSAALSAANAGAEVLLIDENPELGGSLNYARFNVDPQIATKQRDSLINQITEHKNIEVMTSATCNSWHPDNWLAVVSARRLYKLRAKQLVIASGSLEQQSVFRGNDIPGVMMSSAAQRLLHLYAVKPGKNAVVLTGNDEGYACALDLLDAGVNVVAVVDLREHSGQTEMARMVKSEGVQVLANSAVYEAKIDSRTKRLNSIDVREITAQGQCADKVIKLNCDLCCMSVGYMPTYQLVCQAGGQLSYEDSSGLFQLSNYPDNMHLAGSVNTKWQLGIVLKEGERVGRKAAKMALQKDQNKDEGLENIESELQSEQVNDLEEDLVDPIVSTINHPWPMFAHPKGKEFVDYDEDLQLSDIVNATRDGYEHIQLVKRYSTCGMGPSQGRHSALAAARLVAKATNKTVAETGVTTARPPFAAEQLAHNAGRSFYPARRTSMHYRHLELGAEMLQAGAWYRPAFYRAFNKESAQCVIDREVLAVRNNVGIVDVSTLGGIEVRGTQAAEFLNRFYTFTFAKQPIGKARYALLTNEAGVVIDDGVACRLHFDHFYVTATTGGVDRVYQSMLKWNVQWGLDVDIANATTARCGINIAGPKARQVLNHVCHDIDLGSEAFPYMGVREGHVAGIPAILIRVGFVGELGYEIHVPQQYGEALWDALMQAGKEDGIQPFGIEAQRVLRLEKGHVIIGQDTDAMSTPAELQMNWAIARKKPFFVGGRTLQELDKMPQSRVLVGFTMPAHPRYSSRTRMQPKESHLVIENGKMVGRVTSCNYSPSLDQIIGLAYVPLSSAEAGSEIIIKVDKGMHVRATVVALPFYDPQGGRQELDVAVEGAL